MRAVIANFHPRELWISVLPASPELTAVLDEARKQAVEVKDFRAGDRFDFGGATVEVLAPARNWIAGRRPQNNDTLVLKLSYRETSALLEGDAEKRIERLMPAGGEVRADLLKVGHHGSATSSTMEFLSAVRPHYAVISAGAHNPFGYPRPEVLARLQGLGVSTFRTDAHGAVSTWMDTALGLGCRAADVVPLVVVRQFVGSGAEFLDYLSRLFRILGGHTDHYAAHARKHFLGRFQRDDHRIDACGIEQSLHHQRLGLLLGSEDVHQGFVKRLRAGITSACRLPLGIHANTSGIARKLSPVTIVIAETHHGYGDRRVSGI